LQLLNHARQNDHDFVEGFFLDEFQLNPFELNSRFDLTKRASNEA
jgi:hypothetical protein